MIWVVVRRGCEYKAFDFFFSKIYVPGVKKIFKLNCLWSPLWDYKRLDRKSFELDKWNSSKPSCFQDAIREYLRAFDDVDIYAIPLRPYSLFYYYYYYYCLIFRHYTFLHCKSRIHCSHSQFHHYYSPLPRLHWRLEYHLLNYRLFLKCLYFLYLSLIDRLLDLS